MSAPRPVLLWDRTCGFCRRWVERLRYRAGDAVEIAPYQEAAERFPELDPAALARAAHLIETDGTVRVGAEAILRAGALAGWWHPGLWAYLRLPGARPVIDRVYAWIAAHRAWASSAAGTLVGPDFLPRQYRVTRWLLLRLLGVVAVCAFASLLVQVDGLAGEHGISPARDLLAGLERVGDREGWSWLDYAVRAPTLAWLDPSDGGLRLLCMAGMLASTLLVFDVLPVAMIALCYALYLSLITVCGPFLPFQWDTLLCEALIAALFLAPWRVLPRLRGDREPTRVGVWLVRLLVFKLMLMSGLVKLYGDPSWHTMTALDDHFITQPIPTWTAYYADRAPAFLHHLGTALTVSIELGLPWFLFTPRKLRLWFFAGTAALMGLIAATGNYGFFNLLALALAISLLDDAMIARVVPPRLRRFLPDRGERPSPPRPWAAPLALVLAAPLVAGGALYSYANLHRDYRPSGITARVLENTHNLYLTRSYGLFAGMTHHRYEIEIEGSRDGDSWRAYTLRYQVHDTGDIPSFAGPHMPRLDWQMWFAALGPCRASPWFHRLLERLLEGSPAVRGLFEVDPFGDPPPRYLRTTLYEYRFARDDRLSGDGVEEGRWFRRRRVDSFCPTATLEGGHLVWMSP